MGDAVCDRSTYYFWN